MTTIVEERNEAYADAWAKTGIVLSVVADDVDKLLRTRPHMFLPFVTIVCKLMRVFGSPDNPDHWLDIQGYAKLVLDDLERQHHGT